MTLKKWQLHLESVYTKSANEKYLFFSDDIAQQRILSSPNTNK